MTVQTFRKFYAAIPKFLKNKYAFSALLLLVWMMFFDQNDLIYQAKMSLHLSELQEKKGYFENQIEEVKQDRHELFGGAESIEKFAREKYWMKKDDEDIFIIVEN